MLYLTNLILLLRAVCQSVRSLAITIARVIAPDLTVARVIKQVSPSTEVLGETPSLTNLDIHTKFSFQ